MGPVMPVDALVELERNLRIDAELQELARRQAEEAAKGERETVTAGTVALMD